MAALDTLRAAMQGPEVPMTTWENTWQHPVQFEIFVDSGQRFDGRKKFPQSKILRCYVPPRGTRVPEETIRSGLTHDMVLGDDGKILLPSEYDNAIQTLQCQHPGCAGKALYCKDEEHARFKLIVGGLAPMLRKVRRDGDTTPEPRLHSNLIPKRPQLSGDDVDAMLLASVKGAK